MMFVDVSVTNTSHSTKNIGQISIHNTGEEMVLYGEPTTTLYDIYHDGKWVSRVWHERERGAIVLIAAVFAELRHKGITLT